MTTTPLTLAFSEPKMCHALVLTVLSIYQYSPPENTSEWRANDPSWVETYPQYTQSGSWNVGAHKTEIFANATTAIPKEDWTLSHHSTMRTDSTLAGHWVIKGPCLRSGIRAPAFAPFVNSAWGFSCNLKEYQFELDMNGFSNEKLQTSGEQISYISGM